MIISCQFIILDKRPYRENALITSGISPDYGKVSFVVHGAQKLSEKSFPIADLFRGAILLCEKSPLRRKFSAYNAEVSNAPAISISDFFNMVEPLDI